MIARPLLSRSPLLIAGSFVVLFAAVFFLPYHVRVGPAVSLSYLVGYSNQTAFFLFACGSILFGLLVHDRLPEAQPADQRLGLPSLFGAIAIALLFIISHVFPISQHNIGVEAFYALNRIQMLASGHQPYTGFEYAYGPAHLYIPLLFAHLANNSVVLGYYLWWITQWFAGTAMLWAAIRWLELPLPRRRFFFWVLFAIELQGVFNEGTAYTPTRTIGSAFFIVAVSALWNRGRTPIPTATTATLCVAAAFAISPEQGISVFAGLFAWFILLAIRPQSPFPPSAAAIFTCGALIITLVCWRIGEFSTLKTFAGGAYAFPLLPSPTNIVILTYYLAAACVGVRSLLARDVDSVIIPLFFGGFALLPAAMGRCDFGHLLLAAPAVILGVATLESRPTLRRWWSPLAVVFLVIPSLTIAFILYLSTRPQSKAVLSTTGLNRPPTLFAISPSLCPAIYRAVNVVPKPTETNTQDCLDPGYYYVTVNGFDAHAVDVMIRDLDSRPLRPLILIDAPLAGQFPPIDVPLPLLHTLELSPWLPRPRNPPFTYQRLIDAIERNYDPAPAPVGSYRIWYPKSSPPA